MRRRPLTPQSLAVGPVSAALLVLLAGCEPRIEDSGLPDSDDPVETGDTGLETDTGEDTRVDRDNDGYRSDVDCDDLDPRVYPGAAEIPWNGTDDNCDGTTDADGRYTGVVTLVFRATIEGKRYQWDIPCPTTLTRTGWQIDYRATCTPPEGDPMALRALGAQMFIDEVDNVAEDALYTGETEVSSSDGWDTEGGGSATWTDLSQVTLNLSMRATFASFSGSGSLRR